MEVLKVNGVEKKFVPGKLPATVADLLAHLNVNAATVVAEVDGRIVQRDSFARTKLCTGQAVELIRLMGGG